MTQVGDFGIATSLATSSALATTKCGSPIYMSPEIVKGMPYATARPTRSAQPADELSAGQCVHCCKWRKATTRVYVCALQVRLHLRRVGARLHLLLRVLPTRAVGWLVHQCHATHSARCTPQVLSGHRMKPTCTQNHEMCVQLLPSKPQQSTGRCASQWQAIRQLYIHMNHHSGTWARRPQNWLCGGYAELAPKVKLQGR